MKTETGVVTSKGQLVIPAKLRRRLRIKKGTLVSFTEENGRLILQPVTREFIASLQGSLRKEKGPSAYDILMAERKRERVL